MCKLNGKVIYQKHYLLPDDMDLFQYFQSGNVDSRLFMNKGIIYIVMLNGEVFEYNYVASLIFEGIRMQKSKVEIIENITKIFGVEKEKVENDYAYFVKNMLKNQIFIEG